MLKLCFFRKLRTKINKLILKLFLFLSLLLSTINLANASGTVYFLPITDDFANYLNMWVAPASNSTLFVPTIQVFYDTAFGWTGYKGSLTLDSSGNNCNYIGAYRFCARFADVNDHGNSFACDSAGNSCSGTDCGQSCGNPGDTYSCIGYYNKDTTDYLCNNGGYYDCDCPNCRNICASRLCAYQDPSSNDTPMETCDDVDSCAGDSSEFSSMPFMPYFQNQVVAFTTIWGTKQYFNTDGGDNVGCVDIPIGPYPPPYCDPIIGSVPAVSTMNICEYSSMYSGYELTQTDCSNDTTGNCYQVSTSNSLCEISTQNGTPGSSAVYSTFSNPLVRLYFGNTLNICSSNYQLPNPPPSPGNDTCVYLSTNLTPTEIWQDNEVLLPVCSTDPGASTEDCVQFPSGRTTGPIGSTSAFGSGYDYFRVYFNQPSSSTPTTQWFYGSDIASDLSVYGINDSLYADIGDQSGASNASYSYTNPYGITRNYGSIYLDDNEGSTRTYGAFIDLGCDPYTQLQTNGDGNGSQICVDELSDTNGNTPVTCVDRPQMFLPTVEACLTADTCGYASNINISQQPRISVTVGNSYTNSEGETVNPDSGVIGVDLPSDAAPIAFCVLDDNHPTAEQSSNSSTISDTTQCASSGSTQANNLTPCTLDQANLFSAYITDDINYSIYDDPSAINGTKTPYVSGVQYTSGMQYVDYVYCRGATQICLTGYNNSGLTAVSKMVATTTTSGASSQTSYEASEILTDRIIPPYDPDETYPLAQNTLYNPSINNYYSSTTSTTTTFGYYDTTSATYVPGQGCTTTEGMTCCATTNGSSCTPESSIVYPSNAFCTCTNTTGSDYICTPSQCSSVYQTTTTTTNNGGTTTVTTTVSGGTTTTQTYTNTDGNTSPGTMTAYQISGNWTSYNVANSDGMPSPWVNCTYDSSNDITKCPVNDNYGNPLFGTRPLTSMELAQCVDLLVPYCDAIDSTDGYTASNGYATWPQTAAGTNTSGTCTNGAKESNAGPPTRNCAYQDTVNSSGQPVLYSNGCPEYTQVWQTVTNPCVIAPTWWPGSFLSGNSNLQGAIINQFNVAYDYRSGVNSSKYLTPTYANVDPFNLYNTTANTQYSGSSTITNSSNSKPLAPEPWNTCYGSCKRDGQASTSNYQRRNNNGDQEMLYLTQSQWMDLWNNNNLEWLLAEADSSSYDGCYVYSLCTSFNNNGECTAAGISANFKGITPAMKICKSQDNISFALVDLGTYYPQTNTYQYPTDYTNDRYLMQSNLLAYSVYLSNNSGNVQINNWCSSNEEMGGTRYFINNISDQTSQYDTRINNGIVVTRSGFGTNSYGEGDYGQLPEGFVECSAYQCGSCISATGECDYAESVTMQYNFNHYYMGKHDCSCDCFGGCCETCHKSCNYYNPTTTANGSGLSSTSSGNMNTYAFNTTNYYSTNYPMALFSNNSLNLSSAQTATSYQRSATFDSSYSHYSNPNFTSIWLPKACDDDTNQADYCMMSVTMSNYVKGNSAANTAMFLWSGPTTYSVTNGSVGYGSYGQLKE